MLSPARCPNSHRYGPTSFQSDHHAGQCWPVECVTWVWFHRSSACCRTCWIWAQVIYIFISCQQWHNYATPWLTLKVVFTFHQSCALLLCYSLLAKHGSQSSGFLQSLLSVMFWLAEAIHVTGSLEPSTEQCDSALSQRWGTNLTSYHCIVYVHCCWLASASSEIAVPEETNPTLLLEINLYSYIQCQWSHIRV